MSVSGEGRGPGGGGDEPRRVNREEVMEGGGREVTHPDGSLTRVAEGANTTVAAGAEPRPDDGSTGVVRLRLGALWHEADPASPAGQAFTVESGALRIVTTDATFAVIVEADGSCFVTTVAGDVAVHAGGEPVTIRPLQAVMVAPSGEVLDTIDAAADELRADPWVGQNLRLSAMDPGNVRRPTSAPRFEPAPPPSMVAPPIVAPPPIEQPPPITVPPGAEEPPPVTEMPPPLRVEAPPLEAEPAVEAEPEPSVEPEPVAGTVAEPVTAEPEPVTAEPEAVAPEPEPAMPASASSAAVDDRAEAEAAAAITGEAATAEAAEADALGGGAGATTTTAGAGWTTPSADADEDEPFRPGPIHEPIGTSAVGVAHEGLPFADEGTSDEDEEEGEGGPRTRYIVAGLLVLVGLAVVIIAIVGLSHSGKSDQVATQPANTSQTTVGNTATSGGAPGTTGGPATTGTTAKAGGASLYTVHPTRCAQNGSKLTAEGTITNRDTATHSYRIKVIFTTNGTTQAATASVDVKKVAPDNPVNWTTSTSYTGDLSKTGGGCRVGSVETTD